MTGMPLMSSNTLSNTTCYLVYLATQEWQLSGNTCGDMNDTEIRNKTTGMVTVKARLILICL
jgi:hypothetical protein